MAVSVILVVNRPQRLAVIADRCIVGANAGVRVQRQRVVRSWFFAQDGGFYVQCKYGSKAIALSKDGNAIFVKQLSDVKPVLETLRSATENGELDAYVAMAINVRKNREKLPS